MMQQLVRYQFPVQCVKCDSDKVEVVSMSGDAMFYDSSIGSFILL